MPWNNNSGGPWGGGGSGGGSGGGGNNPWGGGNRGGGGGGPRGPQWGGKPPDIEDMLRKGQDRLKNLMPGGFGSVRGLLLVALGLVVVWLLTGFYRVQANERAVEMLFGKPRPGLVEPGLRYVLPSPIGAAIKVDVTSQRQIVIGRGGGGSAADGSRRTPGRATASENLMLTGDENILDIEFLVVWDVKNAQDLVFNIRAPEETTRSAAEATIREIVGRADLQFALTDGRVKVEQDSKALLQRILDEYKSGINVIDFRLLQVNPPAPVIDSFRDVQAARADKERTINQANAFKNEIIPRAKGEAETYIQQAEAYKAEIVARAQGDAQRFVSVYSQYQAAKDITVQRLYLETMEEVLRNANKVVMDQRGGGGGVVPYLPLPELQRRPTTPPAPAQGGQQR